MCYTQPCKPCEVTYILHYLPQGDESSPRGSWVICAPALPEVLTSDASYLSVSNARSRLGCLFFLGNKPPDQDKLNGSILNVAVVIKNFVASAAESEVGACFHNAQSGAPLRVTLTEMGHTQPPTSLRTDNSTAFGILN
jgi:hypothetical protein